MSRVVNRPERHLMRMFQSHDKSSYSGVFARSRSTDFTRYIRARKMRTLGGPFVAPQEFCACSTVVSL